MGNVEAMWVGYHPVNDNAPIQYRPLGDSDKRKIGQELKVQRILRFGMNDAKYLAGNTVNSYEEYC